MTVAMPLSVVERKDLSRCRDIRSSLNGAGPQQNFPMRLSGFTQERRGDEDQFGAEVTQAAKSSGKRKS